MKENFFMDQIKKIEKFYDDNEFNNMQLEAWFEAFKSLNEVQFEYLVKQAFERFAYKPKLSQMLELKRDVLTNMQRTKKVYEKVKCDKCKSTGVIKYTRKIENIEYDFFARCTCKNALEFMAFPCIDDIERREKQKMEFTQNKVNQVEKRKQQDIKSYLEKVGLKVNEK